MFWIAHLISYARMLFGFRLLVARFPSTLALSRTMLWYTGGNICKVVGHHDDWRSVREIGVVYILSI